MRKYNVWYSSQPSPPHRYTDTNTQQYYIYIIRTFTFYCKSDVWNIRILYFECYINVLYLFFNINPLFLAGVLTNIELSILLLLFGYTRLIYNLELSLNTILSRIIYLSWDYLSLLMCDFIWIVKYLDAHIFNIPLHIYVNIFLFYIFSLI